MKKIYMPSLLLLTICLFASCGQKSILEINGRKFADIEVVQVPYYGDGATEFDKSYFNCLNDYVQYNDDEIRYLEITSQIILVFNDGSTLALDVYGLGEIGLNGKIYCDKNESITAEYLFNIVKEKESQK